MAKSGTKVTIKIRAFPYYVTEKNPVTQEDVRVEKMARRGDEVELDEFDLDRAKRFDAILTDADKGIADSSGGDAFSFATANPEQIATFIKEEKPSVDSLVEAVGDDPVLARKVLDGENLATGRQPRSTLDEKLGKVIAGGGDDDED